MAESLELESDGIPDKVVVWGRLLYTPVCMQSTQAIIDALKEGKQLADTIVMSLMQCTCNRWLMPQTMPAEAMYMTEL